MCRLVMPVVASRSNTRLLLPAGSVLAACSVTPIGIVGKYWCGPGVASQAMTRAASCAWYGVLMTLAFALPLALATEVLRASRSLVGFVRM